MGTGVTILAAVLALAGAARAQPGMPSKDVQADIAELWSRAWCLRCVIDGPAARECVVPKDIARTPVVVPRSYARKGEILCYGIDGSTIWAADDQWLLQVDGAAGELVRRYGQSDGLPASPVQAIAFTKSAVWLATRRGLAVLDRASGKIRSRDDVRFELGRLTGGGGRAWLVSDAGGWRLGPGAAEVAKLPEFPGREFLARHPRRGFWSALWPGKARALMPSIFATDDGLYVIVLNRLLRYDPSAGEWQQISSNTWHAEPQGRSVWAARTKGVLRFDPEANRTEPFAAGSGLAAGRPLTMIATDDAVFVFSRPDFDPGTGKMIGGGISRLDPLAKQWTITQSVDHADVRLATSAWTDGREVWAAATLWDRVVRMSAHPGMAHIRQWRPRSYGVGLLRWSEGKWTLIRAEKLKTESRWIVGQQGQRHFKRDRIGPNSIDALARIGDRIWGIYRITPTNYYAGYIASAGVLADRRDGKWQKRFDQRTEELQLAGEFPKLMLMSHSHGRSIDLAEGHASLLGVEDVAGRAWIVGRHGLFVHDAKADRFAPVVREAYRTYWQATAASAGPGDVWFGGSGGSVSRLTRKTRHLELVGVLPARRVTALAAEGLRVTVTSEKTTVRLPAELARAPKLPDADVIVFDGKAWTVGDRPAAAATSRFTTEKTGSFIYRDGKRVAFLKGVFRPRVLCEDIFAQKLWVATYSGVASVPIPRAGTP